MKFEISIDYREDSPFSHQRIVFIDPMTANTFQMTKHIQEYNEKEIAQFSICLFEIKNAHIRLIVKIAESKQSAYVNENIKFNFSIIESDILCNKIFVNFIHNKQSRHNQSEIMPDDYATFDLFFIGQLVTLLFNENKEWHLMRKNNKKINIYFNFPANCLVEIYKLSLRKIDVYYYIKRRCPTGG